MTVRAPAVLLAIVIATSVAVAAAQPPKAEAEFLVPPQGGAYEVPLHAGAVCILSFPSKLASTALASTPELEIKAWGEDGVAIRAASDKVGAATLALATSGGQIKVNVTVRVVPRSASALTLVRFKAASAEAALEAHVAAAVQQRVAPIERELAKQRRDLDAQIRDRADGLIAERLLRRNELVKLESHERSDDHVIVHVVRGQLLGEDGYLVFEIQNRSGAAYRLATVKVRAGSTEVSGPARLASTTADRDPAVIGVVPSGATARGVVVVRSADRVLGTPLALELASADGRGAIRLDRGLVLR